ncbi:MAG TPA: type II toxin-antitoxin system YhaV family toxin [Chloroflexota bacterium]|nr:type II toxin-antitoxin system YhaV family toxin [Chloroflexota bacterium]
MPLVVNGWTLLYHPVCGDRYRQLRAEARRLKAALSPEEFRRHPRVKLAAHVRRLILEIVPANPDAVEYRLRGDLARFRRAKGHGLPPRYRLFWAFSNQARTIIYLYLNDESTPRKEGSDTDPYEVFRQLLARKEIGPDFATNLRAWEQAHRESRGDAGRLFGENSEFVGQEPITLVERRVFLRLPMAERRRMLAEQAEVVAAWYEKDTEWKEIQGGDLVE